MPLRSVSSSCCWSRPELSRAEAARGSGSSRGRRRFRRRSHDPDASARSRRIFAIRCEHRSFARRPSRWRREPRWRRPRRARSRRYSRISPTLPCFAESREGKGIPIDFYFVVDKSNSMTADAGMQTRWSAMVNALNAFVRSPASAGLGAGLNFFPKSSNGTNTLCNVNDYRTPDVPIGLLPDVAPQIAMSLAAQRLGPGTPTTPALEASLAYAKAEKIARVTRDVAVVLVTDGEPTQMQQHDRPVGHRRRELCNGLAAGPYLRARYRPRASTI